MRAPILLFLFAICTFHVCIVQSFLPTVRNGVHLRKHVPLSVSRRPKDTRMSLRSTPQAAILPISSATQVLSSNLTRRLLTGLVLGAVGSTWIASSNGMFAAGFLVATCIMNNEYAKMAIPSGPSSTHRLTTVAGLLFHVAAIIKPSKQEAILPMYFGLMMASLVLSNNSPCGTSQIAKALLGVVYTGYLPSFWVRLHGLSELSSGPATIWWTWAAIASSDVGAYFVGNKFGRHKLSSISAAAGHASPNKSVEGAVAGILCSTLVATVGAYALRWPAWMLTGPLYGVMLGSLGLVGDLTASVMKRDAGVKDTGTLLPGHGGLLDRFDSYILSAPVAYFFVRDMLPWMDQFAT